MFTNHHILVFFDYICTRNAQCWARITKSKWIYISTAMATNKNAQLRYQILDRCFSNFQKRYEINDLLNEVNKQLRDIFDTEVHERQIRDDIKYMVNHHSSVPLFFNKLRE